MEMTQPTEMKGEMSREQKQEALFGEADAAPFFNANNFPSLILHATTPGVRI